VARLAISVLAAMFATGLARAEPAPPRLASPSVIAIEASTGEVLFERRADDVRPIASMTKLFAALVLRAHRLDLSGSTTIAYADAVASVGGARTMLLEGQRFKNSDLLAAMMLSSDNRTPTALARSIGMSGAELLAAMRGKVTDLGLAHTKLEDVTGIAGNASTARDMALALREALRDPVLRKYMTTRHAHVESESREIRGDYTSTVPALWNRRYKIRGGKTGWTEEAGYCEVVAAEIAGRTVVFALLGARDKSARLDDVLMLADWLATSSPAPSPPHRATASR